jgi:hypothetical protein
MLRPRNGVSGQVGMTEANASQSLRAVMSYYGKYGAYLRRAGREAVYSAEGGSNDTWSRRMPSSGMLRRLALVRTDVSEELRASFIRVTKIGELGTALNVASVASYS